MVLTGIVAGCGTGLCSSKRNRGCLEASRIPDQSNTLVREMLNQIKDAEHDNDNHMVFKITDPLGENSKDLYESLRELNDNKRDLVEGYVIDQMYRVHSMCTLSHTDCETIRVIQRRAMIDRKVHEVASDEYGDTLKYLSLDDTRNLSPLTPFSKKSRAISQRDIVKIDEFKFTSDSSEFSVEVDKENYVEIVRYEATSAERHGYNPKCRRSRKGRNGIRDDDETENNLPSGVDLTLSELQEMATRQQRQIDEQQQMLVAKEQRLKFLKHQELRHQQIANENERLRKLREKVEAQELKLKKLRALRGHVNEQKTGNNTLSGELEQIKALFNEKEKELSVAVGKVEDLTRQLDELRNGRINGFQGEHNNNSPAFIELEKLRKELMIRNKLNEQQSSKIAAHREILNTRKQEVNKMDERIAELQQRLRKKKQLQEERQQLANHKPHNNKLANQNGDNKKPLQAVEPYVQKQQHVSHFQEEVKSRPDPNTQVSGLSKQDSKYQSLPYSIKFPGQENKSNNVAGHTKATQDITAHRTTSPVSSQGHISTGPTPPQIPGTQPKHLESPRKGTRNVSPRPASTASVAASFAPKPYGSHASVTPHPVGGVTSALTTVTHASPSVVYTSGTVPASSPHTSTPVVTETAAMREIFITGAPVVTEAVSERLPAPGAPSSVASSKTTGAVYQLASSVPVRQPHHATQPGARSSQPGAQSTLPCVQPTPSGGQSAQKPPSPVSSQTTESSRQSAVAHSRIPSATFGSESSQRVAPPQLSGGEKGSTRGAQSDRNGGTATQPREPPPYDYPHHRKPANQSTSKSESATSLPLVESSNAKALQRQAASDSQLLANNEPSVSSALNVLKSGPAASTAAPTRPRYASRSVIANTYMNKLSSSALDQYRKNMSMLYDMLPAEGAEGAGSPSVKVQPMVYDPSTATTHDEQASPAPEGQTENRDSPTMAQTYPGHEHPQPAKIDKLSNGPHGHYQVPYNIEPERAKLRPNAPRPLRRRLSSGGDSPMAVAKTEARNEARNEARGMFYEEERTSFSTRGDEQQASPAPEVTESQQADTSPTPITQPKPNQVLDPPDLIRVDVIQKESEDISDRNTQQSSYAAEVENIPFADEDSKQDSPVKAESHSLGGIFLKRGKPRRNVTFDPLALLLDAALEGELELVVKSAHAVPDPSQPNDEGITALHNAICAGHFDIVKFLVEYGCNVNAPDSDGWTPLHCAASCNNLPMVRLLVENGACIFATTISDEETAAEKCEEDEEGYRGCSEYLYSIQEKLGIANKGTVYAVFDYEAMSKDELTFENGQSLTVLRKGDNKEKYWWWAKRAKHEGYIARNLLGMYPRVIPKWLSDIQKKSK